uniref:Uncharacterized protein LOC113786257 n=1 Tax=Cicer arietinum TaxID=3827 RepID=A0A3Q7YER6_CICAR|nr:uncharacterized protein LOC113786257 [Cicer arietinum]
MTDLDMLSYFLGIEFVSKENRIFMHQKKYANDVLRRFKMKYCNGADTLIEASMVLTKEGNEELVDSTTFKQLVGSLRYLCNTRPNIAHSVGLVSRYMEKPRTSHYLAAKRTLRYIKETSELGLHYAKKQAGVEAGSIEFTDAYWKQSIVALSTCEAEYVAASMGACQAVWLAELGLRSNDVVKMEIDNKSAIDLARIRVSMEGANT